MGELYEVVSMGVRRAWACIEWFIDWRIRIGASGLAHQDWLACSCGFTRWSHGRREVGRLAFAKEKRRALHGCVGVGSDGNLVCLRVRFMAVWVWGF